MDPGAAAVVSYWPLAVLVIGMVFVAVGIAVLKIHPFLVLSLAAILVGLLSGVVPDSTSITRYGAVVDLAMSELGAMAGSVALVILLAAIIGMCMLRSGAADQIVNRCIALFGERRAPLALLVAGFFLAIPVFFDTVFFLLVPLARALALRTGRNYVLYVLAICAGGVTAHSLVAPTPGPLIMAEALSPIGVDLGASIIAGILAGVVPAFVMLQFARRVDAIRPVRVRDISLALGDTPPDHTASGVPEAPPLRLAVLPVIVPVALISAASVLRALLADSSSTAPISIMATRVHHIVSLLDFLGNKNIAMLVGAAIAAYILVRQQKLTSASLMEAMGPPIATGGVIVLITAAGGAFGAMIRHSGVGEVIGVIAHEHSIDLVLLAWLVAAVVRVAQGSATVAMITTASLMSAIIGDPAGLTTHPIYLFLAIGFGSMFGSWMNDSGFWVVGKISGFTERETLATWTVMTVLVSLFGLIQVLVLSRLLPFS